MIDDPVIFVVMIVLVLTVPVVYFTMRLLEARNQAAFDQWVAAQEKYRIEADAHARESIRTKRRTEIKARVMNDMTTPTASRVSASTTVRRDDHRAVSVAKFDDSDNVLTDMLIAQSVRNDDDITSGTVSWVDDTPTVISDTTPSYSGSYNSSSDSGSSYSSSSSDSSYSSSSDSGSYSSD